MVPRFEPITVYLPLTPYYMNCGFINIHNPGADYLVANGQDITINLPGNAIPLHGKIYPTTNPRIYLGPKYTNWLNENHQVGDVLQIHILSPNLIQLS